MTVTLGLVANVYQEANALPGWLETHLPFFDDVRVLHTGPGGDYSTDGTIELLEKWRVPVVFGSIDDGFGAVRTQAARMSPCDWVMILDADERFYATDRVLTCSGESTPHSEADAIIRGYDFRGGKRPDWDEIARLGAGLRVKVGDFDYSQGDLLKYIIEGSYDAVCTVRRHWHDIGRRWPTQDWNREPDYQMRIMRNTPEIFYDRGTRMHERLQGAERVFRAAHPGGPYFDHFHFHFKRMEMDQRAHDVEIYDRLHGGQRPPTQREFNRSAYEQAADS